VSDAGGTNAARTRRAALIVATLAFAVYLSNLRQMRSGDTIPARLLPFSVLRERDLDLDEFAWLRSPDLPPPYFLTRDGAGHWRSKYPVATPLVAAPLAWPFVWWVRAHGIDDQDARFRLLTVVFERVAAALFGAVSVALVLLAAREVAPIRWAVAAAVFYAFGTSTWVYSQALWQHGLVQVTIAGAALCLLRPATRWRALLAGAATALALATRPTTLILVPIFALYVWRERRTGFWYFLSPFIVGAALLVTYNVYVLGQLTGGYTTRNIALPEVGRLLGLLVSPNRGLLVYCPLVLLALAALRRGTQPVVLRYFAIALPAYAVFFAAFRIWWAGWSFGPRFFTDVMPLVTLTALPLAQRLWARRGGRALLVAGLVWGIGVQGVGVYFDDNDWNASPVSIDQQSDRLWSWSDPQILRALHSGWRGGELAPLLWQLLTDPRPAPLVPLEPAQLSGTIEAVSPLPWRCRAGAPCTADVRITNRSASTVWPAYADLGPYGVTLGAFWRSDDVQPSVPGWSILLGRHLGPGDSARLRLPISLPARAGTYELGMAILQYRGAAEPTGGASLSVPVVVE